MGKMYARNIGGLSKNSVASFFVSVQTRLLKLISKVLQRADNRLWLLVSLAYICLYSVGNLASGPKLTAPTLPKG